MGMNSVAREAMLKSVGVLGNQSTNGVKFSDSAAPPQLVIFCPVSYDGFENTPIREDV